MNIYGWNIGGKRDKLGRECQRERESVCVCVREREREREIGRERGGERKRQDDYVIHVNTVNNE